MVLLPAADGRPPPGRKEARGAGKDDSQELGGNRTSESSTPSVKFCDIPLFHPTWPLLLYR